MQAKILLLSQPIRGQGWQQWPITGPADRPAAALAADLSTGLSYHLVSEEAGRENEYQEQNRQTPSGSQQEIKV